MFQGDSVRNACMEKYPSIRQEANNTLPNRGVTSLLCDHFIDLEYLVDVDQDVALGPTSPTHDSRINTSTGASMPMSMVSQHNLFMHILIDDFIFRTRRFPQSPRSRFDTHDILPRRGWSDSTGIKKERSSMSLESGCSS